MALAYGILTKYIGSDGIAGKTLGSEPNGSKVTDRETVMFTMDDDAANKYIAEAIPVNDKNQMAEFFRAKIKEDEAAREKNKPKIITVEPDEIRPADDGLSEESDADPAQTATGTLVEETTTPIAE